MRVDIFDTLVALHVICAVVGFGSLAITGAYGFVGARPAPGVDASGGEEIRRYFASPGRVELVLLAVPVFGVAALAADPHGRGVVQLWSGLALLVWAGSAVILLAVVRPAEAAVRARVEAAEPVSGPCRRLGWSGVVTDVGFVAALALMIFQPR